MRCVILFLSLLYLSACAQPHPAEAELAPQSELLPTLGPHAFYVDQRLSEHERQPYQFNDLHKAINAAPSGTEAKPTVIYLAPDVYQLQGSPTDRGLYIHQDWLRLVGLSANAKDTVLADNRGHTIGATSKTGSSPAESVFITGTGFSAYNLTIGNYCNVDLVYPRNPALNQPKRTDTITQAYAIGAHHPDKILDKYVFDNVRFISMLDTIALGEVRRVYYHNVYVQGTDDFLGGGNVQVLKNSTIHSYTSRPIYIAGKSGTAFINVQWDIDFAETQPLYLTKMASRLFLKNVNFNDLNNKVTTVHTAPYPKPDIQSYTYNITLNGNPIALQPASTVISLTKKQADILTANALLAGDDSWSPDSNNASSTPSPLAMQIEGPQHLLAGGDSITFTAKSFPKRTVEDITWKVSKPIVDIKNIEEGVVSISSQYNGEYPQKVTLTASAENGIYSNTTFAVKPVKLPAPPFASAPQITLENGKLYLHYKLDLAFAGGIHADKSLIHWYRNDSSGNQTMVATSRLNQPLQQYTLVPADIGQTITAAITPKSQRSDPGKTLTVDYGPVSAASIADNGDTFSVVLLPQQFPTQRQPEIKSGYWTQDTYYPKDQQVNWQAKAERPWRFGKGINGAPEYGLMPASQGARLLYSRSAIYKEMEVLATLDTEKTAAQGFGSPNGQYLEFYIGYNTQTKSGYALRIERTSKYGYATDFTLMHYQNGMGKPLTSSVTATAFNSNTHITLKLDHQMFSAHVSTATPLSKQQREAGLASQVNLVTPVTEINGAGFGLQHTGTVGEGGRFVLKSLRADYR
ncbi:hypothetical protein CA267_017300 [Alteromonas pelagimontana]|uniref:Ig-like domain-containing protein n=1 Tax=Alteromonas pelagimontana TaxID=1858656 RepID=A0A6M4MGR1_9ALTE|nr:hypothetical protein [Alteromonas pelagimontana]QJR82381.1 hypothetical protein CA267_017300 [Alteromonas pelagimontana]